MSSDILKVPFNVFSVFKCLMRPTASTHITGWRYGADWPQLSPKSCQSLLSSCFVWDSRQNASIHRSTDACVK